VYIIYIGKLFDLLNERHPIKCLEDSKQQVQLPGLSEHLINNVEELLSYMSYAHNQRSTGSTGANSESSRSHQIMQIVLRKQSNNNVENNKNPRGNQRSRRDLFVSPSVNNQNSNLGLIEGKLSFIDLAGSERGADTTHNNKQTRMEGMMVMMMTVMIMLLIKMMMMMMMMMMMILRIVILVIFMMIVVMMIVAIYHTRSLSLYIYIHIFLYIYV
jgi:kinesin family protein 2/24